MLIHSLKKKKSYFYLLWNIIACWSWLAFQIFEICRSNQEVVFDLLSCWNNFFGCLLYSSITISNSRFKPEPCASHGVFWIASKTPTILSLMQTLVFKFISEKCDWWWQDQTFVCLVASSRISELELSD